MSQNEDKGPETLSFGKWIREQRLARNVSLEEIAAVTKVHINQLKHLEEDARERLPAPAFVRGFLISYARHLGLEEDEVLSRFKDTHGPTADGAPLGKSLRAARAPNQAKVKLVESTPLAAAPAAKNLDQEPPKMMKPKNLAAMGGLLVVLITLGILISLGKKQKKPAVAPVTTESAATTAAPVAIVENTTPSSAPPPVTETADATKTAAMTTPAKTETHATAPNAKTPGKTEAPTTGAATGTPAATKKNQLELKAIEQSWVNVRIDDKDSSGMNLTPGASANFEADRKITLALSDAGAVEIRWNDTWYAAPGFRGDVKSITLPDQIAKLTVRTVSKVRPKKAATATPAAAGAPAAAGTPSEGDAPAVPAPAPSKVDPATLED